MPTEGSLYTEQPYDLYSTSSWSVTFDLGPGNWVARHSTHCCYTRLTICLSGAHVLTYIIDCVGQTCEAVKRECLLVTCCWNIVVVDGATVIVTALKLLISHVNCGQDYATALDLMQELILTTDVAEHLRVIREIEQMVEGVCKFILFCMCTMIRFCCRICYTEWNSLQWSCIACRRRMYRL